MKAPIMQPMIVRVLKDRSGASSIEYALIATLIAMVIIAGVTALGQAVQNQYNNVAAQVTAAAS